ncbi:MAG: hypothetical protein ACE5FC_07235, partial [Myxococcota bacterium]
MSAPVDPRSGGAPAGNGGPNGGGRWTFLRDAIEAVQEKHARFPHRLFKPLADWASRQEESGFLRHWAPMAVPREAGEAGMLEERDVRLDPFFATSIVLHLIAALLFWQVLAALPEIEEPKEEEVVVKLEDLLPSEAGSPAAVKAPEPAPPAPAAAPTPAPKAPTTKTAAPKPTPRPRPKQVVQKPVPKPEPEPILVPKQINRPRAIAKNAPISPKTPTLSERVSTFEASAPAADVSLGAGTRAAAIDVDRGGGTGIRGPAGPVAVPGGQGTGSGLGAGRGRGNVQGSPLRGFATDPDFTEYLEKIRRRMMQVWVYPPGWKGKAKVALNFRLDARASAYDVS